jgi:membrane protein DedA with SNARE-associated domain
MLDRRGAAGASELVMVYAARWQQARSRTGRDALRTHDRRGLAAYVAVALAGTIGYTIGAIGGWAIGLYGGRPYLERHGRWLHLSKEKLDRAERWFERWEDWAVFLGRLTPVVRSFVSVPAGVIEVPFVRYTLLTLLGSAIWCFSFAAPAISPGRTGRTSTTRSATSSTHRAAVVVGVAGSAGGT